ncbi:MAG: tetratricopeptide repeat protein [Alphaproteobacteria bacterium]
MTTVYSLLELASGWHAQGDLKRAEAGYRHVLDAAPDTADALQLLGLLRHQQGDTATGLTLMEQALDLDPTNTAARGNLGAVLLEAGRYADAEVAFRRVLEQAPDSFDNWRNLALASEKAGHEAAALAAYGDLVRRFPAMAVAHQALGTFLLSINKLPEAAAAFTEAWRLAPHMAAYANDAGISLERQTHYLEAAEWYRKAIQLDPENSNYHNNLGQVLGLTRDFRAAEAHIRRAYELDPENPLFAGNLATFRTGAGDHAAAIALHEENLARDPDNVQVLRDYGYSLIQLGRPARAVEVLSHAAALTPDNALIHNLLGNAYNAQGRTEDAVTSYRAALLQNPEFLPPMLNMCLALSKLKRIDEANLYVHAAISRGAQNSDMATIMFQILKTSCDFDTLDRFGEIWAFSERVAPSMLPALFLNLLVSAADNEDSARLAELHRTWAAYARAIAGGPYPRPPAPDRGDGKIRIGLLSSDLRSHSVAKFLLPLLRNYDRDRFEIFAYTPLFSPQDRVQTAIRFLVSWFVLIDEMSDEEVADRIRSDQVDILIDLNGITASTEVQVMVRRPAPVQVTWLGYPFTTGLSEIDHVILDRYVAPQHEGLFEEKPLIMPNGWLAFAAREAFASIHEPGPLPAEADGVVTFGTLNATYKYTTDQIACWAEILRRVPNSRFLIVRPEANSAAVIRNVTAAFEAHGIETARVQFLDNQKANLPHMQAYQLLDISLDTFPLTGGTTTVESLWMGVPVISLVGDSMHQRISYSALAHCGVEDLCAWSRDEYVAKAVALAQDLPRLAALRAGLRDRMRASPLCDEEGFARDFEAAMERIAPRPAVHAATVAEPAA